MKASRLFRAAGWMLERRPWLPGAVFLATLMLALLSAVLLLANVCDSPYRFLPEFPDRLIVFLGDSAALLAYFTAPKIAVVMIAIPVVMICFGRFRAAGLKMLVASFCSLLAGLLIYAAIFVVGLLALSTGQTEVAEANLARRAEAESRGEASYVRKAVMPLRQMVWTFAGGRYRISREGDDDGSEYYWLVDEWARYDCFSRRWNGRVLLYDVARWDEGKDWLYLETLNGKCYELEFATGKLTERKTRKKEEEGK